jgi:DNA polymerase-3 subunit epsilon
MNFPWFGRREVVPFARAYCEGTEKRVARKTPVDELNFVVLDAETTGFDPVKNRILSLATLPVRAGVLQVSGLRSWLVFQPAAPLTEAVQVHGILPADTKSGEPEPVMLEQVLPMLTGAVLVGHHLGFDVAMLNAALHRHFKLRLRNPLLDTAHLAMHALDAFRKTGYAGQRVPSLDEVCLHCDVTPVERHTAPGDTFTTAELLLVLCARYERQLGRPLVAGDLPLESAR